MGLRVAVTRLHHKDGVRWSCHGEIQASGIEGLAEGDDGGKMKLPHHVGSEVQAAEKCGCKW